MQTATHWTDKIITSLLFLMLRIIMIMLSFLISTKIQGITVVSDNPNPSHYITPTTRLFSFSLDFFTTHERPCPSLLFSLLLGSISGCCLSSFHHRSHHPVSGSSTPSLLVPSKSGSSLLTSLPNWWHMHVKRDFLDLGKPRESTQGGKLSFWKI